MTGIVLFLILIYDSLILARACCVVLSYLIYNFHWTIGQALAFTQSRRPEINPKSYYIKQLKVSVKGLGLDDDEIIVSVTNSKWQSNSTCASPNEIVVRNTVFKI